MSTAANTSISYQGAADAGRVLPGQTGAFTDARFSRNSCVDAVLLSFGGSEPEPARFDPSTQPVINVFLWVTDRLIFEQATQFYSNSLFVGLTPVGSNKTERSLTCLPTNGVAALPLGAVVQPITASDVGRALRLSYSSGGVTFDARGTALYVQVTDNAYLDAADGEPATCGLAITALSECILAGADQALFTELTDGQYSPFEGPTLVKRNVVLLASDYFAGQYWTTGNRITISSGGSSFVYEIVGIYTVPIAPGP